MVLGCITPAVFKSDGRKGQASITAKSSVTSMIILSSNYKRKVLFDKRGGAQPRYQPCAGFKLEDEFGHWHGSIH